MADWLQRAAYSVDESPAIGSLPGGVTQAESDSSIKSDDPGISQFEKGLEYARASGAVNTARQFHDRSIC